jgi:HD-GYP domain-containing protein (c-di-GMP phosphodiesterase class II)
MYKKGLTSDEALYWIRKTRPGSVDPVQEEILRAFETFLKLKKERGSGSG